MNCCYPEAKVSIRYGYLGNLGNRTLQWHGRVPYILERAVLGE
jgi:hypothetical protein